MADKSNKRSEIWNFFQIVEDGDKTKCNFCDVLISYKNSSTKGMWDHVKSRHPYGMADENKSVKQKFGSVMRQTKLNFGGSEKFSKERHEICYRASAEVRYFNKHLHLLLKIILREVDGEPLLPELY